MQTILAITYVDSNTLDAVAEHCIPMLADWAQKGSLIEQHLAAELLMLISGRFDHTSSLIAQGALPKLVSLFMSVDDIEANPKILKLNRSTGFRSGCLQPERAVVFAHQVPLNLRQAFQRIYPRVKDIYHEADDEAYQQSAHRADRLEWSSWVNSGTPLAIEIKRKLTAREFEGVSKVKSAGVTRQHLNELFDLMCGAGSSQLTEATLDGRTIATYLSGYGLGDAAEIEQVIFDTGIYQHGIGELDDDDMHNEMSRELFCRWLLMSMPETDALMQGQEVGTVSLALRVLRECIPHSRDADCDPTQLKLDAQDFYDEIYGAFAAGDNPEATQGILHISHVARYLVESKQLGIGTCEQVESAIASEITEGKADVDAHVQLSARQLQIMKDEITKATVHTLTEIAMAQGAQGRADMIDGGVLVIISRCFKLFKPPEVHALALNMLHALMNGRFSEKDISHDADLLGFYSEINEFKAHLGRDESSPLLQFERLTALERRKAHMMAAFLGMYHRSVGSPVNRKVVVSPIPITKAVVWRVVRADTDDTDDEAGIEPPATMPTDQRFVNPIADADELYINNDVTSDIILPAIDVPSNEFPSELTATNDDTAMPIAISSVHDAAVLQKEDAIFESSREKIANTGITSAVRTLFPFPTIVVGCCCSSAHRSSNLRAMHSCCGSLMLMRRLASQVCVHPN
jgi:hypothetical protein